jgi:predicted amidophosphoribosyltransferase
LKWERLVRLGDYEGLLRDAIHDLKFSAWRRVGRELGTDLGGALAEALRDAGISAREAVIVPVPTSFRRRMARGIDHTLVLARAVRAATGVPIAGALRRLHRPSQLDVPPSARRENVAGSMRARGVLRTRARVVIVLDDVVTTGATMTAACRAAGAALRRGRGERTDRAAGMPVLWALCLGVTPEPGRRNLGQDSGRGFEGAV